MDRLFSTTIIPDVFQGMGDDFSMQMSLIWGQIKVTLILPLLKLAVVICLTMSLMLFIGRVYMGIVIMLVKLFGKTPEKRFKWEPLKDDVELGNTVYPMVLIRIPMYNEREVYQLSIGAACDLAWPSDRIIIQVLDDSTDPAIKDLVELECRKWANKGIDIKYEIRDNRDGYKAGALKQGMERDYVKHCDYVAIFDADFQPEPDFLARTIPFLVHNSELALVQARWQFVVRDGVLAKFNYGRPVYNLMHYGEAWPPIYNISNIRNDLLIFISYGGQDALSDVQDVGILLGRLKFYDVNKLMIQYIKDYAHGDFIMGINAKDIVYNQVVNFFKHQQ